jgi:Fe-S cluster assembly protein SufD
VIAAREGKDVYLSSFPSFEEGLAEEVRSPLRRLRRAALERFAALGFPNLKDEDWRFTNLAPLLKIPFEPGEADGVARSGQHRLIPPDRPGTFLVFENGQRPLLRHQGLRLPDGVVVCTLAEALTRHPDLVKPHLARYADYQNQAFTALNTAFLRDGAFVYVPAGKVIEEPIYLTFATTTADTPFVWHRRCLLVSGPHSQARVVESYTGPEGLYFTNAVTEVVAAQGAVLDYYRLQRESKQAFHVATVQVRQDRNSNFTSHALAQGGSLARTDLNVVLDAEGGACTLNGLYLAAGDQLIDNTTRIDHARPRCTSHELYKGILDGRARGVFNGKIHVHRDAQKTDARQTNKTLLLSDDALIDSKPQLEIYADDVKCTHGASVGQLDEEQLFYLRTRGLGREAARQLLTYAFANEIVARIRIDWLRAQLGESLFAVAPGPVGWPAKEVP